MTTAEFHYIIEHHRIRLEWALNWRASIDSTAPLFAWADTAMEAVQRLADKAGWLAADALFPEQEDTK